MDQMIVAVSIDLVGWVLWFLLTRMMAKKKPVTWVTWDYYISTFFLGASTFCTTTAAMLDQPGILTNMATALMIVGLFVLAFRAVRTQGRRTYASNVPPIPQQVANPFL